MTPEVRVAATRRPGCSEVSLHGEIDLANARDVEAEVRDACTAGDALLLDLSGVSFMDSSGLAMIDRLRRSHAEAGLCLVVPPAGAVRRLLDLSGLGPVVPVAPTLDGARALVDRG